MRITIKEPAKAGKIEIPPGDYYVSVNTETNQILLSAGGKEIKLPSVRRGTKPKGNVMRCTFNSGGGTLWSLMVSAPHEGEFIATIEYKHEKKS